MVRVLLRRRTWSFHPLNNAKVPSQTLGGVDNVIICCRCLLLLRPWMWQPSADGFSLSDLSATGVVCSVKYSRVFNNTTLGYDEWVSCRELNV